MQEWLSRAARIARSRGSAIVGCTIVVAFAYSLCRRALNLTDEGYLLSQVVDMLDGKVLYRDMDAFVTPGIWLLLGGLFKVVEPSVLASRILSFAGLLGTFYIGFRIVAKQVGALWGALTVALLMIACMWSFPAWTMVFYSPFAVLLALVALERLLAWHESGSARDLVLCGLLLGCSIACKQNYGAFATAGILVALVGFEIERRKPIGDAVRSLFVSGIQLSIGALAVLLPIIAYLALNGALVPAFELLVLHPFEFMSKQDIPFPALSEFWSFGPLSGVEKLTYGAYSLSQAPNPFYSQNPVLGLLHFVRYLERLHILLFWLPVLGAVVGLLYVFRPMEARRPIDGPLFAVISVAAFVFLGVFPRADFNHLMNVYQPVVVAGVILVARMVEASTTPIPRLHKAWIGVVCLLMLSYTGIAMSWYAHTITALNDELPGPRGGVLVSSIERDMIEFQVDQIREMSDDGDYVLTVPALAMFNFLADRRMPGRYYNLYEHHIAHDGGAGVVEATEDLDVALVVSDYNNFFSDRVGLRFYAPELTSYLGTHFETAFDVASDRFFYMTRRDEPLPPRERIEILDDCELEPKRPHYVREHLLFASLYQARNSKRPRAPVDTRCPLIIPSAAEFVVALKYRRPFLVAPGTALLAEAWIEEGGRTHQILAETIPVEAQDGWLSDSAREFRIDVSEFAGEPATIRFRTTFRGRVKMGPLDLGGFSFVWQDPHLELR